MEEAKRKEVRAIKKKPDQKRKEAVKQIEVEEDERYGLGVNNSVANSQQILNKSIITDTSSHSRRLRSNVNVKKSKNGST